MAILNFILSHKKLILALVLLLLVSFLGYRQFSPKPQTFDTVKVEEGPLEVTVSASGSLKSQHQVNLNFQTAGQLAWIGVGEGDWVRKGQPIASLDKRQLQKDLKKKLLAYMNQRWDFEQNQEDYNVSGDPNLRIFLSDEEKRIVEKAQFALDTSVLDVETNALAIQLATIYSPINGLITNLEYPVPGLNVLPTSNIATVAAPDKMVFEASIDEADIGNIAVGQLARITLDAYEEEVEGLVSKVDFSAITTRGGGTAFPVEITMPSNNQLKFKIGMNGDVEIRINSKESAIYVPSSAIWQDQDKNYVWKVVNNQATKQEVKLGLETDDSAEITEGLKRGDLVINEDLDDIKEGQQII